MLFRSRRTLLHKSTIFLWNQCLKALDCYVHTVMMVQVLVLVVEARRVIMLSLWCGSMILNWDNVALIILSPRSRQGKKVWIEDGNHLINLNLVISIWIGLFLIF